MVLVEGAKGAKLMTGGVDDLIPTVAGLKYYSAYAFLDNLVTGDSIEFTIYIYDPHEDEQKIYDQYVINGAKAKIAKFIPNLPTGEFRVTAEQKTSGAGGYKTVNWVRYDS